MLHPAVTHSDACGLLAALAVMAEGMVEDKVTIVFDVFDFNKMERLTQDELVSCCTQHNLSQCCAPHPPLTAPMFVQTILFMATNASLARYSGQKITPSKSAKRCEALSKAAFSQTQADTHITAPQFAGFVSKFMKVFKNDGKRHLQPGLSPEEQEKYSMHGGCGAVVVASFSSPITPLPRNPPPGTKVQPPSSKPSSVAALRATRQPGERRVRCQCRPSSAAGWHASALAVCEQC